jgi:hypothetical protein
MDHFQAKAQRNTQAWFFKQGDRPVHPTGILLVQCDQKCHAYIEHANAYRRQQQVKQQKNEKSYPKYINHDQYQSNIETKTSPAPCPINGAKPVSNSIFSTNHAALIWSHRTPAHQTQAELLHS